MYTHTQLIVFDLDGTLAESKSRMDAEMAPLLGDLLCVKKVAVMSGGRFEQFKIEFLDGLRIEEDRLRSLYLFPTCATSFYQFDGAWKNVYHEKFSTGEKRRITGAFRHAMRLHASLQPVVFYGDVLEDRDSQITYSAAGQQAPVAVKRLWDPDAKKRLLMKATLDRLLPEFEVRIGGMTSIDVTRKGIDKAYGIQKIEEHLRIRKSAILFVGDALFPGGNDYPVKEAGVATVAVSGPEETKRVIHDILAASAQKSLAAF